MPSVDPEAGFDRVPDRATTLVIACGALARELVAVLRASRFDGVAVTCLPAILHNHPERIAPAVQARIRAHRGRYDRILCLYGDCGTGGALDRVLEDEGVVRIDGPHCYSFYLGRAAFDAAMEDEPGTFFLTDYLVRHFDRLVIGGLGLDRFPELLPDYFGHYSRVVYLAQTEDARLEAQARAAAERLGLAYERRDTGLDAIGAYLAVKEPSWPSA